MDASSMGWGATERPSVTSGEVNLALQHRVVEFACLAVQWSTPASDALLQCTLSTITETRAASMMCVYAYKWRGFESLCEADPVTLVHYQLFCLFYKSTCLKCM